jgi:hypothetical protein
VEKADVSHRIDTTPNVSQNNLMAGLADNKFAQMFLGNSRPNPVQMKRVQVNNAPQGYTSVPQQAPKPQMDNNTMMTGVNNSLKKLNNIL